MIYPGPNSNASPFKNIWQSRQRTTNTVLLNTQDAYSYKIGILANQNTTHCGNFSYPSELLESYLPQGHRVVGGQTEMRSKITREHVHKGDIHLLPSVLKNTKVITYKHSSRHYNKPLYLLNNILTNFKIKRITFMRLFGLFVFFYIIGSLIFIFYEVKLMK